MMRELLRDAERELETWRARVRPGSLQIRGPPLPQIAQGGTVSSEESPETTRLCSRGARDAETRGADPCLNGEARQKTGHGQATDFLGFQFPSTVWAERRAGFWTGGTGETGCVHLKIGNPGETDGSCGHMSGFWSLREPFEPQGRTYLVCTGTGCTSTLGAIAGAAR